ncbi:MAG: hypothetical protein HY327_02230 [Chloroflexi bacterium]|nr:hypothetical protein [Chloroflexota bacterium]
MKNKTRILILDHDDPKREFEFELEWLMSLTTQQRFEMMISRSNEIKEMLIRHGHRKPIEIIKRPSGQVRRHRRKRVSSTRLHARNGRH